MVLVGWILGIGGVSAVVVVVVVLAIVFRKKIAKLLRWLRKNTAAAEAAAEVST